MHIGKIAVLGSNSFAGSAYVNHALFEGYDVLGISRSPEPHDLFLPYKKNSRLRSFQFRQLDLNENLGQLFEALSEFKPKIVVDFAAQSMVAESWEYPEHWYQTNIVAKVNLHSFLRNQTWLSQYVRISTPEVYGSCDELIRENRPYNPSTPYAVSQAAIDMSLKVFYQNWNFPVIFGRFANFYGEHQQLYRIIPKAILSSRLGVKLPLHGGGKSVRAFIHAEDVCRGISKMIEFGEIGQVYHFSPNQFDTIKNLVVMICEKQGLDFEQVVDMAEDRPGKDQAYLMSAQKAKEVLGWAPKVSLSDGVERTLSWVDEHLLEMRGMPWNYAHKK